MTTLASGSSGNCLLASDGATHVLIDAGISARRITTALRALGVEPGALSAVLITHEHSDHIKGLTTLSKRLPGLSVCAAGDTGRVLTRLVPQLEGRVSTVSPGERFRIGTLEIGAFATLHDCVCPVGYTVTDGSGAKLALATDLGEVTEEVRRAVAGARLLVAEANYDRDALLEGPYPDRLKERILSRYGHLSNRQGGALAAFAAGEGARKVILGHLSKENNTPKLAYETVSDILAQAGVRPGRDVLLSVASRDRCDGWVEV